LENKLIFGPFLPHAIPYWYGFLKKKKRKKKILMSILMEFNAYWPKCSSKYRRLCSERNA